MATQSLADQMETQAVRLKQLLGFLDRDPDNQRLLADAASAALDARMPKSAVELLARAGRIAPLSPALRNMLGMACMQIADHTRAADIFAALIADGFNDPNLRFNLAWARAVSGDFEGALEVLDDAAVAASPRGPALKVQMWHHLGRLTEALAEGVSLAAVYPTDPLLMGSLSSAAMDAGNLDLAAEYAIRGGDSEDALATMGMLRLGD